MKYKRVILKLSGEALLDEGMQYGVSIKAAKKISKEIKAVVEKGVQVGVVVGAGNIFRGAKFSETEDICQAQADRIGMLATVMNGLALQEAMRKEGLDAVLMSALWIQGVAGSFDRSVAISDLENGKVLIFCGGTGSPFFSTDTAASLRALEIDADVILKGTKVDGIYSDDPVKNPSAKRYESLKFIDVLQNKLKVMDLTAISMCMDHNLPIVVFNIFESGNLKKAVKGENIGTVVYG